MGKVEIAVYVEPAERLSDFAAEWSLTTSACLAIEMRRRNPMKYLRMFSLAACAAAAFMSFASAYTSRKTGFSEFHEFDDLTVERNTMSHTYLAFGGDSRCIPVSKTITSDRYESNCYVGGSAIDTVQLTVPSTNTNEVQFGNHNSSSVSRRLALNTGELTVRSTTTSEFKEQLNNSTSSDCSESSTSTIGTDEGTQLKARLA